MYNLLGEACVCILALILTLNTLTSFYLKTRRNFIFLLCSILGFLTPLANIISIECITTFPKYSIGFSTFVAEVYFILLGLQMMMYASYCYEFVSPFKKHEKAFSVYLVVPFSIYLIITLASIKTGWLFKYTPTEGYVRGPLKSITYLTSFIYICTVVFTITIHRKVTSRRLFTVFLCYPIISISISLYQFFSTYNVMTGLASFAPLMLMYLGVQSEQIAHDFATGALTEKQLPSIVDNRRHPICLTLISIENYDTYREEHNTLEAEKMMLLIAKDLFRTYGRKVFRMTTRLAVITRDLPEIKDSINSFFDRQEFSYDFKSKPEIIAASVQLPQNAETYSQAMEILGNLLARNRLAGTKYTFCDDIYVAKAKREQAIYKILERELRPDSEQFQVFFQPIYSISENKFVYSEALSRLRNTELGDISPAEFIPVAESKGLIEKLGQIAFEKICRFISENRDEIGAVSVNFSVQQMSDPLVVPNVLNTIAKYNLEPKNIIMEITESIFIKNFDDIKNRMDILSKEGIMFYLDDFGTGFSNFANVINLPFSTIKIDRSFVLKMEQNKKMSDLVRSLIATFKDNGLKILVEGVETEVQDELVKNAGTDYIQGFLYERPLPADQCLALFEKQK